MEEDFFLKKMRGVKPFKKEKTTTRHININKKDLETNKTNKTIKNNKTTILKNEKHNSNYYLSFDNINKDLKRGKVKIDRRIDLHGYTLTEANYKFKNEVVKNYNSSKRCLLVITGKGVHKKPKIEDTELKLYYGKIKNSIIDWINEGDLKKYILTYQDAGIEHGGDGAIFVYLRKKKF